MNDYKWLSFDSPLCILGPYDVIHVGAAAPTLPPALVEQLARPGRMFIPVGDFFQHILEVDKDPDGNVTERNVMDVRVSVFFGLFAMNHSTISSMYPSRTETSKYKGRLCLHYYGWINAKTMQMYILA
jgi:hypothetical protein